MTHEITMKSHDDHDKKKKGIAFKSSIKEEESSNEDDDDKLAMMARRFKKFFRKRGQRFNQKHDEPFKKSFKEDPQKRRQSYAMNARNPAISKPNVLNSENSARTKRKVRRQ